LPDGPAVALTSRYYATWSAWPDGHPDRDRRSRGYRARVETLIAWCGFLGAWLLFAGPIFQAGRLLLHRGQGDRGAGRHLHLPVLVFVVLVIRMAPSPH
jgi:hypothetical protein